MQKKSGKTQLFSLTPFYNFQLELLQQIWAFFHQENDGINHFYDDVLLHFYAPCIRTESS